MKKIVTIVLLFTSFLFKSNELKASHAAGGELVYTLVNAATNTYKFTFKFYRDCSGTQEPATFQLCGSTSNACGTALTATLNKVIGNLPNGFPNGSPRIPK